jgi:hypothetical protein
MVNCGREVCFARGPQALSLLRYINSEFTIHNLLFPCSLAFNQFPQSPLDGVYWRLFRTVRPEVDEGIETGWRMKDRFQVPEEQ